MYETTSLQNQCIFYKLENAEKKYMLTDSLSAIQHLQKAPIKSSAYRRKYRRFKHAYIRKNTHY